MMDGEKAASGAGRGASDQRAADERERTADERERKLGEREPEAGLDAKTLDERTLEAIDRARYLLALSAERLNGQEARVERGGRLARGSRHRSTGRRRKAHGAWQRRNAIQQWPLGGAGLCAGKPRQRSRTSR